MTEPENFDDDLFADLYVHDVSPVNRQPADLNSYDGDDAAAATTAAPATAPQPTAATTTTTAAINPEPAEQSTPAAPAPVAAAVGSPEFEPSYDGKPETGDRNADEERDQGDYDDDDEVDFNLGGPASVGGSQLPAQDETPHSVAASGSFSRSHGKEDG
jgi:hypothetical protein